MLTVVAMSIIGSLLGAVAISHYFGFLGVAANGPGRLVDGSVDGSGGSQPNSIASGENHYKTAKRKNF